MRPGHFPALISDSSISGLDYRQVECIQRKRLLAFVNHFVAQTASFLSNFGQECEAKLQQVDLRIQRLDTDLTLLESKLDSVPELRNHVKPKTVQFSEEVREKEAEKEDDNLVIEDDPQLKPFVRMLSVGVPPDAVRQKMLLNGFEASFVDQYLNQYMTWYYMQIVLAIFLTQKFSK